MKKTICLFSVIFLFSLTSFSAFAGGAQEKAVGQVPKAVGGDLTVVGWSYAVDYAKELVQKFEEEYGVPAEFLGLPTGAKYNELLIMKFLSREPIDVLYLEDFSLTPFIASGWIQPLSAYAPPGAIEELVPLIQDSFVSFWTVNNELYALPYYQTVWLPAYNTEMFAAAGIDKFPSTWEELKEAALAIKDAGIVKYPITFPIGLTWTIKYQVYSMVFSEGGRLFNDNLDPVLDGEASGFRKVMNWLLDGLYVSKIINPKSLETNENENWRAFAEGQCAFTMIPGYRAAQVFDVSLSKVADKAALDLTPGKTNETVSWSRGYVVSTFTDASDQLWKLIDFLGGKGKSGEFPSRRGWMSNYSLDSGYKHMWQESDVRKALSSKIGEDNIDILRQQTQLSRSVPQAPWMAAWVIDFERELHRALTKEISLDAAIKNLTDSWETKRKRFPDF